MSGERSDMADIVRLRPGALTWREVEGEVVAVDVRTSTYIAINKAGAVLWPALERGAPMDELAQSLVQRFGLVPERARADAAAFVAMLAEQDLLTP